MELRGSKILVSCNTGVRNGPDLNVSTMGTRSATKQQELEQNIGNLTALMKELKAGQDEQARHQEEQQTKLFDDLRGLIECQGKQLMRLAEDYKKRLNTLATSQVRRLGRSRPWKVILLQLYLR